MAYSSGMKNVCEPFEGKKVTVMGLGLLGRGVGDVEFLAKCGAQVLVTDKKGERELAESIEKLKNYPNVIFRLGGHDEKDFADCDMVLKAAGVPLNSPYIGAARRAGVPVYMSTALFAKYAMDAGATVIGVTGTRGKSTTTQMIYHALVHANKKAHLGGNIRGISTLALLPEVEKGDIVVLELDSWQLQGFGDLKISPQISVFTNLMADHQNYYPDMDTYFRDKANIYAYQKQGNVVFCGWNVEGRIAAYHQPLRYGEPRPVPSDWHLKIIGEHNRENAALAISVLNELGLSEHEIRTGIESFEAVEGRLQLIGEKHGVKIYNDNNATTPDATIAGLRALDTGNKNIILIMGGADKGLDMSAMREAVHAHCKKVFFLAGTGTDRIRADSPDTPVFSSLYGAFEAAMAAAASGDIILFSPAFASFGMFKNEYERNDDFIRIVNAKLGKDA